MTALAFLRGSGWGKRELATWLVSRYRPIVAHAAQAGVVLDDELPPSSSDGSSSGSRVEPKAVAEVMREAKARAMRVVQSALGPDDKLDAGWAALERSYVVLAEDCMGEQGFIPVDRPRMKLGMRVASLLLSHRLTSPGEFEGTWSSLSKLREELEVDELWTRVG